LRRGFTSLKDQRGFTLLEALAVVGVITILAATLVPMVVSNLESARLARCRSDVQALTKAVGSFRSDTKEYPTRNGATPSWWYMLSSGGTSPNMAAVGWGTTRSDALNEHLVRNTRGYAAWSDVSRSGWRGPYLPDDRPDPWGRQYLISVRGFWDKTGSPAYHVWAVSAGPDGALQTDDQADTLAGDDIGELMYVAQ
jgi:prepilin-type N-terminal cleavage/methylation domain-containing protein